MTIDWTVSIGNIVTTFFLLMTLVGIALNFGRRFTAMEKRVNIMFAWFLRQIGEKGDVTPAEILKFFDANGGRDKR